MRIEFCVLSLFCFVLAPLVRAASGLPEPSAALMKHAWPARWVTHPDAPKNEYGVYLFRKTIQLDAKPARFVVHLTADARYRLFVNGRSVTFGPQRSDAWVWHYETVDLAPFLVAGTNVIGAQVWSYGDWTPYAITGIRTGFLMQGDTAEEAAVSTDASWIVRRDAAHTPIPVELRTYIVIGPGNRFEGAVHPWDWTTAAAVGEGWVPVRLLKPGNPYGWSTDMEHWLRPRTLPLMEETPQRLARVRRTSGVEVPADFLAGKAPLVVPARSRAVVLLDQGFETNAFPQLTVSEGRGSRISLTYAEALVDHAGNKGNRDDVEGKTITGVTDVFVTDGGTRRSYAPLDFRTYRYLQLDIATAEEPVRIEDLHGVFTGYPFRERGGFASDDPELARIWEVGWRTARLCAFETYVDCPYYEQLQYVGDTRIQALISLYVSGDDRLMRNAIELFDRSRIAEGLTQSRYPSVTPQVINTFSLFWIDMVHDYWMHREDDAFVRARLDGVRAVLAWFEKRIDTDSGLLGPLQYWTFVDWADEWVWSNEAGIGGEPEGARSGGSSIVSLLLAGTCGRAAELLRAYGDVAAAERYERLSEGLKAAVQRSCWDEARQRYADTPEKRSFSQHANTLAILTGTATGDRATALIEQTIGDASLIQCSTYFRFYLLRALKAAGRGDQYLAQLGPWRAMLQRGLTTFAERLDPTRSDCHAWSASPVYELLATVCGVEPGSPGFRTVRVEPHLGSLQHASGVVPHPAGDIRVAYTRSDGRFRALITLPPGVSGEFVWKSKPTPLHPGEQALDLD